MLAPRLAFVLLGAFAAAGCSHALIEGTRVRDTPENRAVLDVVAAMQSALEAKSADQLLTIVSPNYFEDMGTADPADDFGYDQLKTKILPESFAAAREVHVAIEVHDVVVDGEHAWADVRYSSRAWLNVPGGDKWDTRRELNRIELAQVDGAWLIVSGL